MNFIKSNLTKMVLCALFVVSIQASDKTELITTKQKKALPPETVPAGNPDKRVSKIDNFLLK